jgi:subtilisin family serine protease
MAAPHVIGAAAIYLEQNPAAEPWQVRGTLTPKTLKQNPNRSRLLI